MYLVHQEASEAFNSNINTATVNGSIAANKKRFLKFDIHVPFESDPDFACDHGGSMS
jgi:hypothetical protein